MLSFLSRRRFNYIDILVMSIASASFQAGDWLIGIFVLVAGLFASTALETHYHE